MKSLLARATKDDVHLEPFPHLLVRDVLDDALCLELLEQFPPLEVVTKGQELGSNKGFALGAHDAIGDPRVSQVWQDVLTLGTSQEFLDRMLELFGDAIRSTYPSFESDFGPLDALRAGVFGRDTFDDVDVLLEAQIGGNTPVVGRPSSVRPPHLDDSRKIFNGLLYLRPPEDDTPGGDLEIYRYKRGPRGFRGVNVYDSFIKVAQTIRYERNVLLIMLNTVASLHGVTPRAVTPFTRHYLNLFAQVDRPLYDLAPYQADWADKLVSTPRRAQRRLASAVLGD